MSEDEAVKRVLDFLEYCKVGRVTMDDVIGIRDNCESLTTRFSVTKGEQPGCFFTTGFLNGVFSAVRNQHVREVKCVAMGDPRCEWQIV